jgi:hypothetical protein
LLLIAETKIPPFICFFPLIYPLLRFRSIWLSLDQTANKVDNACQLEYRLVTAWEYRDSSKKLVRPLLKEVTALLESVDLKKIFKIRIPKLLLWAIPPLLIGIFFHTTLLSQLPGQALISKAALQQKQTTDSQIQQQEKEKQLEIQKELVQMADQVQEVASSLQEGSLDEKAAMDKLNTIKEKLQKNLIKEKEFLEFTLQSELLVRFFNKLAKLDMAIGKKVKNKRLKEILDAISITIPIVVYNPNAPYDPRFARSQEAKGEENVGAQNKIGELIDSLESKLTSNNIVNKKSTTGAPVNSFSVSHLPRSYQHLVRSYFGSP